MLLKCLKKDSAKEITLWHFDIPRYWRSQRVLKKQVREQNILAARQNFFYVTDTCIKIYYNMELWETRMQENNFLRELRNTDLIFIHFIFLQENWVQYKHWHWEILQ